MIKPKAAIRRFDVFAEYNRQQVIQKGMPANQAKGYALWLAKVVAARRFAAAKPPLERAERGTKAKVSRGKWSRLDGKAQTDKLFEQEIVSRMGQEFYRKVLVPAIRQAIDDDASYKEIHDTLRTNWKP
jgi:hypothetical protein